MNFRSLGCSRFLKFLRTGTLKKREFTTIVVPLCLGSEREGTHFPPSIKRLDPNLNHQRTMKTHFEMEAIEGSASPLKPNV